MPYIASIYGSSGSAPIYKPDETLLLQMLFHKSRREGIPDKFIIFVACFLSIIQQEDVLSLMGMTGIDSLRRLRVSMPGDERATCQKFVQTITGESNYAMAA